MTSAKLASILAPLRCALDYGLAASLNGNDEERQHLEALMMSRLLHAASNAGLEIYPFKKKSAA